MTERYSKGAIWLHWIIALALAFQLSLGFGMPGGPEGFALFQLHKSVGIAILLLTLVRIGWRVAHKPPPPVEAGLTGFLAKAVHFGLYAFMLLAPLSGWALVSTDEVNIPTVLFGVVPLPHLPLPDALGPAAHEAHEWFAYIGLTLFALHVAGALRHHFLVKDALLSRMSLGGSPWFVLAMLGAVLLVGGVTLLSLGGPEDHSDHDHSHEVEGAEPHHGGDGAADVQAAETTEHVHADGAVHDHAAETEEASAQEPRTATAEPGPPPSWAIQPGGHLGFSVGNGDKRISGSFSDWTGAIRFDPDNPASADIRIDVDLSSASVGDATQDGMLRGAEFLDSGNSPSARWRSSSVESLGGNRFRARGTLTLKGVSRPQALTFTLSGNGMRRSVRGDARIDRKAFGIGTGSSAESLSPSVALSFRFDAVGRHE